MINNTIKISITALLLGTQLQAADTPDDRATQMNQSLNQQSHLPKERHEPQTRSDQQMLIDEYAKLKLKYVAQTTTDIVIRWMNQCSLGKFLPDSTVQDDEIESLLNNLLRIEETKLYKIANWLQTHNLLNKISNRTELANILLYLNNFTKNNLDSLEKKLKPTQDQETNITDIISLMREILPGEQKVTNLLNDDSLNQKAFIADDNDHSFLEGLMQNLIWHVLSARGIPNCIEANALMKWLREYDLLRLVPKASRENSTQVGMALCKLLQNNESTLNNIAQDLIKQNLLGEIRTLNQLISSITGGRIVKAA